uniref:DUF2263 domain-containing protein n=1 Tax=Parastrongyloides trichosuri TaxID=131310 RepID=A0A0N4ZZI8_PARTI
MASVDRSTCDIASLDRSTCDMASLDRNTCDMASADRNICDMAFLDRNTCDMASLDMAFKKERTMIVEEIMNNVSRPLSIKILIDKSKIINSAGFKSIYFNVHEASYNFNGRRFLSIDDGYQYEKLIFFCGRRFENEYFNCIGLKKRRSYVKKKLEAFNFKKDDIISWRCKLGFGVLIDLYMEKFKQNQDLFNAMLMKKDFFIVHAFNGDSYGGIAPTRSLDIFLESFDRTFIDISITRKCNLENFSLIGGRRNLMGCIAMIARWNLIDNNASIL